MIAFPKPLRAVYIATYPPRKCGIATYTKDLVDGINALNPERLAEIIALTDDTSTDLTYPWEVSRTIRQEIWGDYEIAIDYINRSVIDVVCLQHEFGIYGGAFGRFAIDFVRQLKKPVIVTCHSVLKEPKLEQKKILAELGRAATYMIVMLEGTREVLAEVYGVPPKKIVAIHHGAPDLDFEPSPPAKKRLGFEKNIVMSSVNLLGRGRGIEYALTGLPKVIARYPNFLYLIVGQTHPHVLVREGEAYRQSLEAMVKRLKLAKNVRFVNRYVSLSELIDFVRASDLYITPYDNMETASSGSLAYAIAAGKVCVATPFQYAQEMLAGGRGVLVEPKNGPAIAAAILHVLDNPDQAETIRRKCYQEGRRMTWTRVGYLYMRLMRRLAEAGSDRLTLPRPNLGCLRTMTDQIGLLEHSRLDAKNYDEGYATDDNARALVVATIYGQSNLARRYLGFLRAARVGDALWADRDRSGWIGQPGTGDWFGRALWALAHAVAHSPDSALRHQGETELAALLPAASAVMAVHTLAYVLLALFELRRADWPRLKKERAALLAKAEKKIRTALAEHRRPNWFWPEAVMTYDNPRLAEGLIAAGAAYGRPDLVGLGTQLLQFALDQTFDVRLNHFRFIGNRGWRPRGGTKAAFDEQSIEAGATARACAAAFAATGLDYYRQMAVAALMWFEGENIHRQSLINRRRHSVYDGITPGGLNLNQGAESLLEYLFAYDAVARIDGRGRPRDFTPTSSSN